jgi:hypothetical protein
MQIWREPRYFDLFLNKSFLVAEFELVSVSSEAYKLMNTCLNYATMKIYLKINRNIWSLKICT